MFLGSVRQMGQIAGGAWLPVEGLSGATYKVRMEHGFKIIHNVYVVSLSFLYK